MVTLRKTLHDLGSLYCMTKSPHTQRTERGAPACEVVLSSHLGTSHCLWSPHRSGERNSSSTKQWIVLQLRKLNEILALSTPETLSPSDSVQQAQRGVGSPDVDVMLQDELVHPLHSLLAPLGHERRDPQDAAVEAVEALQQLLPPSLIHQVLEGALDDRGIHSHQVRLHAHILRVLLDRGQIAPARRNTKEPFATDVREGSDKHEGHLTPKATARCAHLPLLWGEGRRMNLCNKERL